MARIAMLVALTAACTARSSFAPLVGDEGDTNTAEPASVLLHAGSDGADSPDWLSVDDAGRVFVCGGFTGTIDFGGNLLVGTGDIFAAAFEADGTHLWSGSWGGTGTDSGRRIAASGDGGAYLVAVGEDSIDYGGGPLPDEAGDDFHLVALDANGQHVWSRSFGGPEDEDVGGAVVVDTYGDVIVGAMYSGTLDFGGEIHTAVGERDAFIASYAPDGLLNWSQAFGSSGRDATDAFALHGDVLAVGGFFNGGMGIDTERVDPLSSSAQDGFTAALNAGTGDVHWARNLNGTAVQSCEGLAWAGTSVVTVCSFNGRFEIGGDDFNSNPEPDGIVIATNRSGDFLWHVQLSSDEEVEMETAAVSPDGDIYVGGGFAGTMTAGDLTATSRGVRDAFFARLDASGNVLHIETFGGPEDDLLQALAFTPEGRLLVAIRFRATGTFAGFELTSQGETDIAVLELPAR